MKTKIFLTVAVIALSLSAVAQTNSQTTMTGATMASIPMFRVNVISRRLSGQLSASQRSYEAGFCGHGPDAFSEWGSEVNSKRGSLRSRRSLATWRSHDFWQRVSHLICGRFHRGPGGEPGRSAGRRNIAASWL